MTAVTAPITATTAPTDPATASGQNTCRYTRAADFLRIIKLISNNCMKHHYFYIYL